MPNHTFSEEILHVIQSKSCLAQLEAVASGCVSAEQEEEILKMLYVPVFVSRLDTEK